MTPEASSNGRNDKDYWRPFAAGNCFQCFGHARQEFHHRAISTAQIHESHYYICKKKTFGCYVV